MLLYERGEREEALRQAIAGRGLVVHGCADIEELCAEMLRGAAAALAVVERLGDAGVGQLRQLMASQRSWSDFPLVVVTDDADSASVHELAGVANTVILTRPISLDNVASVMRLAARARGQQYAQRDEAVERVVSESRLRGRASTLGKRIREQAETLRLLRDVATAANFAESVDEALCFALAQVCRHTGWAFGQAYLPRQDDPGFITPVNASYDHAPGRFDVLREAMQGVRLLRGEGLAGRVYASGQPEWTRGVERELDAERARLAEELGVVTAAAFPVLVGTDVVGVLEFFADEVVDPGGELLDAMASVGTQLGRVIERDRLDRALRDSMWFTQKITDTAPTMIRVHDVRANRYVFANTQMATFLGLTAEQLLRSGFDDLLEAVHPDDLKRARGAKDEVYRGRREQPVTWQVRMRRADGEWRWVRSWSVLFAPSVDQAPSQVLSVSIDVTDEVLREEKLRRNERLTSIGTLAAGIAHEVNNPLASVVMTAQLLRRRHLGQEVDEMLDDLIEDARRCGRIVRNVQRFARQEPSERRLLDLNTVVRAAEELCRTELRHNGVRTALELAEDLPPIAGDPTELEQVIINLITNAAHASDSGKTVCVRSSARDGEVRLIVQDEGVGMPPDVKRHAFDPFYTTRVREGGTGLGLSIAHGIVEDHGGAIDIETAVGRGTTITIRLPSKE